MTEKSIEVRQPELMDSDYYRIQEAIRIFKSRPTVSGSFACACLGPNKGEPECPCRMAYIVKVADTYYQIVVDSIGQVTAKRYQKLTA